MFCLTLQPVKYLSLLAYGYQVCTTYNIGGPRWKCWEGQLIPIFRFFGIEKPQTIRLSCIILQNGGGQALSDFPLGANYNLSVFWVSDPNDPPHTHTHTHAASSIGH